MKVHKPDLQAFLPHQVDQEGQEDPVCRREEALICSEKISAAKRWRYDWNSVMTCTSERAAV